MATILGIRRRDEQLCACCLGEVTGEQRSCPHCQARFDGAGRFNRLQGPRPSALFLKVFRRDASA